MERIRHLIKGTPQRHRTQAVIDLLVHGSLDYRSNAACASELPRNDIELRREIERLLESDIPDEGKERLKTIHLAVGRCSFERCVDLFAKHQNL